MLETKGGASIQDRIRILARSFYKLSSHMKIL